MNINKRLKIAGALQMVQSAPYLIFSAYYAVVLIHARRDGSQELSELPEDLFMFLIIGLGFLCGVLLAWFGYSLIRQKTWPSRIGGFLCCLPCLISFPHVISLYTLWVLILANRQKESIPEPVQ